MRQFFLVTGFLIAAATTLAQKGRAYAGADKKSILIGEQFHLKLDLEVPKGQAAGFFTLDTIPHFEILNRSKMDTFPSETGGLILSQTLLLTSWDSGRWQIPAFTAGKSRTTPLTIDVGYTPLAPNQAYHDIKDIVTVKAPEETNWYWYLAGLALLLILYLLFFPRGKPKEKTEEKVVEDKDAYGRALRKLEKLKHDKQLPSKEYYTALIYIFREYLEQRKHIHSFSQTTEDLARQIRELPITREQFRQLVETLSLSDMVKFARYEPSANEYQTSTEIIKQSIVAIEQLK